MLSLMACFSFLKGKSILLESGRQGTAMFLEHRTIVKMDLFYLTLELLLK